METDPTTWEPARLLHMDKLDSSYQFALLVLNQPIRNLLMLKRVWEKAFFRIAADGGANRLHGAEQDESISTMLKDTPLEVVCGDLDSIDAKVMEAVHRQGTKIVQISDQDSTDFEKCVNYLRTQVFPVPAKFSNILCLGGLGGRLDHGLSQLHQLYKEQLNTPYDAGRIYLLTSENLTFVLRSGVHRIHVQDRHGAAVLGTHVGIIPLKGPSVISTQGLEWDVRDWRTEFGAQVSTSNLVREEWVEISTTGDVLFTIEVDFGKG